ncbi:aldehyde dehydrogenase [Thermoflavimicrobium dichotomicum]|uniref:Aldehyde dehydrogenase n=1 Tax=Thermoflavimicrobium dichotomicum TaxID=46223 RepID=A0A1I3MU63_9BACL|nr:aldehyde dehydrogenase [Thermoflavimicrobium dichotomicum]SFJ00226.1 aldehyde dehydrogenase (NAD+) [Thermoflavimicrobium dichotomicum]
MEQITKLVEQQKAFFYTGKPKELEFRLECIQKLKDAVKRYEPDILNALKKDLNKSEKEAYMTEIATVFEECNYMLKNLRSWSKPQKVRTALTQKGARNYIYREPYGVSLIIGPWNYPFMLVILPLIGALAAGNCAILKPSEIAPHVSRLVAQMIEGIFNQEHVAVVEGGVDTSTTLLNAPVDFIFFTGSEAVGKIVMEAAAKRLTPLVLELGGKSPCIIDEDANLELAAKRIIWGKLLNAGQTCVAPDYLLVHERIKNDLLKRMKETIRDFYGEEPIENPNYGRIVNEKHFERLTRFLTNGDIVLGGKVDKEKLLISPTILDRVSWDDPVMKEEIFGPILPVLTFTQLNEAIERVRMLPKPLALYYFSESEDKQRKIIESLPFGGGCMNDTIIHMASPYLPFGGVGTSGMGRYRGKSSYQCFSYEKSILKQTTRFDIPFRYPTVKNGLKWLRYIMK